MSDISGMTERPKYGWHSRGYLPHFDSSFATQFITYRLADAIPRETAEKLHASAKHENDDAYRRRIERYLDAGRGACWLRDETIAGIVLENWLHFDGVRYRILAWVIMPNHVHRLVEMIPPHLLAGVIWSWKSYTAKKINAVLGRSGQVWQAEYWDRFIRNEAHFKNAVEYIHENPVKAGFVDRAEDWRWSSAALYAAGETQALVVTKES
ncbi:transposase [bacterium]|nr:transposase [bacterium]